LDDTVICLSVGAGLFLVILAIFYSLTSPKSTIWELSEKCPYCDLVLTQAVGGSILKTKSKSGDGSSKADVCPYCKNTIIRSKP